MALPSPFFVQETNKTIVVEKAHVNNDDSKKVIRFIAFCKFCQEGFSNDSELYQHRKAHEKCPYDECKFNASLKVVTEHIARVHLKTNALVKISDLVTPEQIEKWREDRRKRYPTTANVELRQQARQERFQRGEKLQNRQQRFGDFQQKNHIQNADTRGGIYKSKRNHNQDHHNKDRRQRKHNRQLDEPKSEFPSQQAEEVTSVKAENITPPQPQVTRMAVNLNNTVKNNDSSDEESAALRFKGTSQMKDYSNEEAMVTDNALSMLGMYGSDTENEDEELPTCLSLPDDEATEKSFDNEVGHLKHSSVIEAEAEATVENEEIFEELDEEAPDETPVQHTTAVPEEIICNVNAHEENLRKRKHYGVDADKGKKSRYQSGLDYSKLRRKPSVNPFLEKLLQEDIRHERNVLLQCVNYVVKNHFFDQTVLQTVPLETKHIDETKTDDPFVANL